MKKRVYGRLSALLLLALCFCVIVSMSAPAVYAVPAYSGYTYKVQPDGTKVKCKTEGDEYFHYCKTSSGSVIQQDPKTKVWKHVYTKNGKLYFGANAETSDSSAAKSAEKAGAAVLEPEALESTNYKKEYYSLAGLTYSSSFKKSNQNQGTISLDQIKKSNSLSSGDLTAQKTSTAVDIPLLTIVIGFNDVKYSDEYNWNSKVFSGDTSVSSYYEEMSEGKFTFAPCRESSVSGTDGNTNASDTKNDGVVHISLDRDHGDWQGNCGDETICNDMISMMTDAINASDNYVNYKKYDTDKNGTIAPQELSILFVVAGDEAATGITRQKSIWAHRWELTPSVKVDGVKVSDYIAIGERHVYDANDGSDIYKQAGTGVVTHELGHILGLPDLYDIYYGEEDNTEWENYDVDYLSVMCAASWGHDGDPGEASTNWYPGGMDPYCRIALGYITPKKVTKSGTYTVSSEKSSNGYKALIIPTDNEDEYFIVEDRQYEGFDKALSDRYKTKGSGDPGIVVWHIDEGIVEKYSAANEVNTIDHRPGVMPAYYEKATAQEDGTTADIPDIYHPFLSSSISDILSDYSVTTKLYNGDKISDRTSSGITITTTSASSDTMEVSIKMPLYVGKTAGLKASSVSGNSMKISWKKAANAKGYRIYRASSKTGKYHKIKTTSKTSYTDSSLKAGTKYWYKVRAYRGSKTGNISSALSVKTKNVTFSLKKNGTSVKVHWTKMKDTDKYQIAYRTGKSGKFHTVFSGTNSVRTYTSVGKTNGKTYYYKMRYQSKRNGKLVWNKWTGLKSVKI